MTSVPPLPPSQPQTPQAEASSAAQQPGVAGYAPVVYPQGYAQPYAYAPPRPTNVLSIVALVLALIGISIGGVICGHISLSQIKRSAEQGRGMALAGLIIGYVGCALWVIGILFWIAALVIPLIMLGSIGAVSSSGISS